MTAEGYFQDRPGRTQGNKKPWRVTHPDWRKQHVMAGSDWGAAMTAMTSRHVLCTHRGGPHGDVFTCQDTGATVMVKPL